MPKFDQLIKTARNAPIYREPVLAGNSAAAHGLRQTISLAAQSTEPIQLSTCEGAGYREIAMAIHARSFPTGEPFIDSDCHAMDDDHFAIRWRGTLFLEDVGGLSSSVQQALFDWMYSDDGQQVRVISLTSIRPVLPPLAAKLSAVTIPYPPLADRKEDIPVILQRLWASSEYPLPPLFERSAWSQLLAHDWPGNFDELRDFSARAARLYGGRQVVGEHIGKLLGQNAARDLAGPGFSLKEHLGNEEKMYLIEALLRSNGVVQEAAKRAGVNRTTFIAKMKRYGLAR